MCRLQRVVPAGIRVHQWIVLIRGRAWLCKHLDVRKIGLAVIKAEVMADFMCEDPGQESMVKIGRQITVDYGKAFGKEAAAMAGSDGGNQAFLDGSARWIPYAEMLFIHSWNTSGSRNAYFFQEDLGDFVPMPANRALL